MASRTSRHRNPRGEGGRLREHLIAAAAEVLDDVGDADRVSVRAIAQRAGVSPTALYLHFPDRDALLAATVDAGFQAFNETLLTAAAEHDDPRAALAAMGRAYLRFTAAQPALYAVLFSARRPLGPSPPPDVDRAATLAGLASLLRACDPALDAASGRQKALDVWSALHGFAILRAARGHLEWPSDDDYSDRVLAAHLPSADL
jgi:AcrR family transcriptional regulator